MKKRGFTSMQARFIVIIIIVSLISAVGATAFSIVHSIQGNREQLAEYRKQIETDVEMQLKMETQIAVSLIDQFHQKQLAGEMTEEEAKKAAADLVRELRYDDGAGYFWVDTYEGVNVVLLGRDTEGNSRIDAVDPDGTYFIQEMLKNGKQPGGGFTNLKFAKPNETEPLPKRNYTVAYEPYEWVLGTGVWIDDLDAMEAEYAQIAAESLKRSITQSLIFMVILLVILLLFAFYVGKRISDPLKSITKEIERMENRDFRRSPENSKLQKLRRRKDEIGSMSDAIVTLQDTMGALIGEFVCMGNFVSDFSDTLAENAGHSSDASDMVAQSVSSVAESCNHQTSAVAQVTEETAEFSRKMQEFGEAIDNTNQKITTTNDKAAQGQEDIDSAVQQMRVIEEAISGTAQVVAGLGEQVNTIGTIVDTISDIASQTNLLSLNASIEAARAGSAGKGFAVVADEIRKLADQSDSSAGKITELVKGIQLKSEEAVAAMERGLEYVKEGTGVVGGVGTTFSDIVAMVSEIADDSKRMEELVTALNQGTDAINGSIGRIDAMNREVEEETENVSQASDKQSGSMHEIITESKELTETAHQLQEMLSRFVVDPA
ncbi:MAG: cache domain-containing protein [Lachnospiraceae bacterium]|nr:cache domain-containing protein [Lachnospiraceae bacterium]